MDAFMDIFWQILPDEIIYKILSYLPGPELLQLNLSNKQYWDIYQIKTTKDCLHWNSSVDWIEYLCATNEMILNEKLYVLSLRELGLNFEQTSLDLCQSVSFENKIAVVFKLHSPRQYIWCQSKSMVHKTVFASGSVMGLKELDSRYVDEYCSDKKIVDIFDKYVAKYIRQTFFYELNGDLYEDLYFPPFLMMLYLNYKPNMETENIEFSEEFKTDSYVIWKVYVIGESKQKRISGRAVFPLKFFQEHDDFDLRENEVIFENFVNILTTNGKANIYGCGTVLHLVNVFNVDRPKPEYLFPSST